MIKEDFNLDGVKETMLIPLYSRAWASKRKNPEFVDEVAVKVVDNIDYDFKKWKASKLNIWGCAGRTVILDRCVREYIASHPDASIVNLASGLDDRFSRVDNGRIRWYNIDFEDVITLRHNIIEANDRVVDLAMNMLDYTWMDEIEHKDNVLVIAEGVLMYIKEEDAKGLFDAIGEAFTNVTLLLELMTTWMVDNQKLHDVTKKTDNVFVWGLDATQDFVQLCPSYRYIREFNITDSMRLYSKFLVPLISKVLAPKNNRIAEFELIK